MKKTSTLAALRLGYNHSRIPYAELLKVEDWEDKSNILLNEIGSAAKNVVKVGQN